MRKAGILLLVVATLLSPRPARADDTQDKDKAAMDKEVAQAHHETAKKHFRLSNFEEALVQFNKAYKYAPLPKLLYNIAACHEGLGNLPEAINTYWLFLEKMPGTPHRTVVEARIKNLTRRLKSQQDAKDTSEANRDKPAPPQATRQPAPAKPTDQPTRWKKIAGWTAVGVGGAALITGAVFGALAEQKESEYRQGIQDKRTYFEQQQTEDAGRLYQSVGVASLVAGAVIAGAGGGLLLWEALGGGGQEAAGLTALAPMISNRCAGVVGQVRF